MFNEYTNIADFWADFLAASNAGGIGLVLTVLFAISLAGLVVRKIRK